MRHARANADVAVLRAIVADYVATNEPVGSKALAERHDLGVSPATVRNDMAVLEEEGYIAQPHTSAGRVPTDKGYRLFVDRLSRRSSRCRRPSAGRSSSFLDGAVDLDDVLSRTVRLLAQLTRQVAVVQYPTLSRSPVRHLEVVHAGRRPADAGADHRHRPGRAARRRLPGDVVAEDDVAELRALLNAAFAGAAAGRRRRQGAELLDDAPARPARPLATVAAALLETLVERRRSGWSSAARRT